MATLTLIGTDDIDRAPIPELRALFGPGDPVQCEDPDLKIWLHLWDGILDDETRPVAWRQAA